MLRYLQKYLLQDLKTKMVFVGGPRQVGKTTLTRSLFSYYKTACQYFNWDNDEERGAILKKQWRKDSPLIIFDELHKYPRWKQWIKGVYDVKPEEQEYLVTGSARLDIYKKGGDSLLGRYHYWRLHPLTLDELPEGISPEEGFERLLTLGGFPEPFLQADEREARRWRRERFDRVLHEDIRDLEDIRNIQLLQLFVDALRERAGSLITLSNLATDLQISPKTAKTWLSLLERMYLGFAIYPYKTASARSIIKPPKFYFYDNADTVNEPGVRLENLVATTLLKRLQFIEDYYGYRCNLHYIRDKEGREVDFATVIDNKLDQLIEVKYSDAGISKSLQYYTDKLQPKQAVQIVATLKHAYDKNGIRVTNPIEFFKNPPWEIE
ncbi:MAG: ATP-binding protein [Legionellales bacterium]|nr:ATP-binding protein [Legionellales bacterium]